MDNICKDLLNFGKIQNLKEMCEVEDKLVYFSDVFKKCVGFEPWSLQKTWAKRYFMGNSFAIVAPTGVGKTTFGIVVSILAEKSLLIFPTKLLAEQAYDRIVEFLNKLGYDKEVVLYRGRKREKEKVISGDFDILIGTNMFLHKNLENIRNHSFDFIFVDDTDSFLKSSKNIDGIFHILGFLDDEIKLALKENKTEEDYEALERIRNRKHKGVLIISSATLKPKTKRVMLFKQLLGFDIQKAISTVRNVVDSVKEVKGFEDALNTIPEIVEKLGKGGLLFVSARYGKEVIDVVVKFLRERGFNVLSYTEKKPKDLYEEMERGEFDLAVGLAHIGNPLVRGIDLPAIIRYAIFLDVPKFVFPVKVQPSPANTLNLLVGIYSLLEADEKIKVSPYMRYLRKYRGIKPEELDKYPKIKERVLEIYDFITKKFKDKNFIKKLNESEDVSLEYINGEMYITVADVSTYIQASGRTSRLVAGGLTKGLSLILYWDKKSINSLKKRLTYYFHVMDIEFQEFDKLNLQRVLEEIDRDREMAKGVIKGGITGDLRDVFKTTLVIVESPNKARTIASFFGKPQMRTVKNSIFYEIPLGDRILSITASLGHILDLKTEGGFYGVLEDNGSFVGIYDTIKRCKKTGEQHTEKEYLLKSCKEEEIDDKAEIVESLRRVSYEVNEVFVATDPDAEGEKIAYDIYTLLSPYNKNIYRAEFHEITPKAFRKSLEELREFNINRVKAQITRRIADRWVGFTLSRILWDKYNRKNLSAGRVQTPVLGWIIERAYEFKKKIDKVTIETGVGSFSFTVEDKSLVYEMKNHPERFRAFWGKEWEEEKSPPPPYTTDTILQDASLKLKLPAQKTMQVLQDLFEKGVITYHRTDSTRVSDVGKYSVAKVYIEKVFGEGMFYPRSWGEGGAHECIRPTRPITPDELRLMLNIGSIQLEDPKNALRVYSLIFNRFIASQMKPTKVKMAEVIITFNGFAHVEETVRDIVEDGYNLVLKNLAVFKGDITIKGVKFSKVPKALPYTQGTLIQEMKKRGLGRPSTYAQIVQTLLERDYVIEKRGYLFPTKLGISVYMFLKSRFDEYVNEDFTRKLEREMDEIEEGKKEYMDTLRELYKVFSSL